MRVFTDRARLLIGVAALLFAAILACAAIADRQAWVVVRVESGDTLWGIAVAHTDVGEDVRPIVRQIALVNGLEDATLMPGMELWVPEAARADGRWK